MGDLLDQIRDSIGHGGQGRLKCDVLLDELPSEEAADFRAALEDPTIPAGTIRKVMERRGHTLSDGAVRTWRNKNHV